MKQTFTYVKPIGAVPCRCEALGELSVPVFLGILKHPRPEDLPRLLARPAVLRKYTAEALRKASWQVLGQFPKAWLLDCIDEARLTPSRKRALLFLLS